MTQIWIANVLPMGVLEVLPAVTLIIIGLLVEKNYVGRIALLSNAVALTTFFYRFEVLPEWLVTYINLLSVAGILALASYALRFPLPRHFYWIAGLFSSAISGVILIYGMSL